MSRGWLFRRRRRGTAVIGTTTHAPDQPTISAGTPTSSGVTLTGSAFSDPDVGDTHAASQWQVTTSADTGYASPVISTGDDATNKTSYAATGLSASTAYIARVRYKDSAGNYSAWSTSASFTTASGFTAFDKGFNFRATSAFVTDGANETYSIYPEAYPTTRNGVTFGVTSPSGSVQARDRNAALDRRLAGTNWDSGEPMVFRVDLPAPGTYAIRLALGDENASTAGATIKDGATTRLNIPSVAVAAGHSLDATGADYTAAAWPGSNTPVSITMTGTVLTLTMPINNAVQHLFISRTA